MNEQARYIHLLQTHDWTYEFSDDQSVWLRGTTQRRELNSLQPRVDPLYHLWNQHAPSDMQIGRKAA